MCEDYIIKQAINYTFQRKRCKWTQKKLAGLKMKQTVSTDPEEQKMNSVFYKLQQSYNSLKCEISKTL